MTDVLVPNDAPVFRWIHVESSVHTELSCCAVQQLNQILCGLLSLLLMIFSMKHDICVDYDIVKH